MSRARFLVGDVFDRMAELESGSVDMIVTSPPFLALRSYLPADHPDKAKEIGSEPTPAEFVDTLLRLSAEWRRLLAPHGSIAVELGDTYSGSGGAGGDYNEGGLRERQEKFVGSGRMRSGAKDAPQDEIAAGEHRVDYGYGSPIRNMNQKIQGGGPGWPLAKSKTLIPELYRIALAYGIHPLTGQPSPAGTWRVRNVVTWCRPNPPVGALGDKWRPATSDVVVACVSGRRYWDDVATRRPHSPNTHPRNAQGITKRDNTMPSGQRDGNWDTLAISDEKHPAGAPLLDYWEIPPGGYNGKTATYHREPCGPHDGGERTTSPDCPTHAGRPDRAPTAPDGEREGTRTTDNAHTDAGPVQGLLLGSAPTDPHTARATGGQSSDSPCPVGGPAASRHDKGSNRTDPAPGTNPPGMPSVETPDRTDGRPASPDSGEHHPGTSENSISEAGSRDSQRLRTSDRTADTDTGLGSSEACTCSWSKVVRVEFTSHYAVYPPALIEPLIKAMAPPKVCVECGEPSRRIVETSYERLSDGQPLDEMDGWRTGRGGIERGLSNGKTPARSVNETTGFTDCGHDKWRPALILDPFAGSGTTLMVATGHGHDAIGIDLDERNAGLAVERVGGLFMDIIR